MTTGDPTDRSRDDDTQSVPPLDAAPRSDFSAPPPTAPRSDPAAGPVPEPAAAPPPATPGWGAMPPPATPRWGAGSTPGWGAAPTGAAASRPSGPPGSEARNDRQGSLVLGIFLVVLGTVFLVTRLARIDVGGEVWPLWIIAIGAAMLIASLTIRHRAGLGLAIPGGIVLMVGTVLWVQNTYDLYQTWAYAWALVAPGGVGLGMLLHGLATGDAESRGNGVQALLTGLGLFAGFALLFEGIFGISGDRIPGLEEALPFLVIALGVVILGAAFLSPRGRLRA